MFFLTKVWSVWSSNEERDGSKWPASFALPIWLKRAVHFQCLSWIREPTAELWISWRLRIWFQVHDVYDLKSPTIAIKISPFPKLPILETYEFIYINYICFRDLRGYNYTHMMGSNLWYLWLQLYPSTSPIAIWGPRWLPSRCQVMPAIPVWPPRMDEKTSDWRIRN